MPPALGAPKYIPSSELTTPKAYLDQLVYGSAGEPVPSAAPVATENSAPPPSGDPYGGYYQSQAAPAESYATEPVGGNDQVYFTDTADPYANQRLYDPAQQAPSGWTPPAQAADPYVAPSTGGGASTYYGGQASAGGVPYGTGQTTSIFPSQQVSENDPYGAYGAAEPLPASGQNNWAPSWNLDEGARTAQRAGTWIGQGLGILPQTAYAQQEEGLTDQVGGGGGGRGSTGGAPSRGVGGRPLDSEPGGVRAARQGMVPGSVRVGDSPTVNPAVNRGATLPSSEPIGVGGRRIISNSATAPPSSPRNMGQIRAGAQAVGDPYSRMPTGTTPASTSIPGYTVATGNPAPARGVTGTTPAGPSALPTGTTAFPPLPFSPTIGVPGLSSLTPKQIGVGLAGLAGLGAGATFGPAYLEDVALRDVSESAGETTFVPGDPYGPRAPWPRQGQRVGSSSARDQGDVRADTLGSAQLRDAAWTSGTRDWLEGRRASAPGTAPATDPYADTTSDFPAVPTSPVVNDGDVSRNRAAKLLTPDLQFVTSERTSDAWGGGTGSQVMRVIHGDDANPVLTDALVTPDSMGAAQAAGMVPWVMTQAEWDVLHEAGLVPDGSDAQLVSKDPQALRPGQQITALLMPKAWAEALGTSRDTLTDVQAVDPYTAPATDTSSDSGSGWVDYGNDGGGGGYRRRSYSSGGGGGGGYSRSYGGGGDWGGGGFDMSWLPEGFGGEDGFMSGSFDSPIFARYLDVLSRHMGEERAMSLLQGMRGMKRGFKRSKRSRSRSMPNGRTLTTKGPRQSSVNEGLSVPSNESVRKDVGKQIRKSTKDKEA